MYIISFSHLSAIDVLLSRMNYFLLLIYTFCETITAELNKLL